MPLVELDLLVFGPVHLFLPQRTYFQKPWTAFEKMSEVLSWSLFQVQRQGQYSININIVLVYSKFNHRFKKI